MNNNKSVVIYLGIVLGSMSGARADGGCNALLSGGVFDTRSSTGSTQFESSFKSFFCSHATRSSAEGNEGGLKIDITGYGSLGGNTHKSQENKELNDLCSSSGSTQNLSQTTKDQISKASEIIVNGFNNCMKQSGVNAYTLYSPAESTFNIALSFLPAATGLNYVEVESYDPTNAKCRIGHKAKISNSISYFVCTREDKYKGSQVIVHLTKGLGTVPLTIDAIEKPWTPRKIRGFAPTSKPGEYITIQQVGTNFHWDLDSYNPQGKLAFKHSLDGYFTSPSDIVGIQKRKNVDPASSQNGCVIVQPLKGDVPQDYVVDFIMSNAPASEQPSGTVKGDGKFCDLDHDWSGAGRLNIQ